MSMDLGGAKGGIKSDINVTPLVDVMLVLLIIMMLVAPMLQQGVSVKLPKAANATESRSRRTRRSSRSAPTARCTSTPNRCRKRELATRVTRAAREQDRR